MASTKPLSRRGLDWLDDAPVRATLTTEMDAPPEAVFAVLADHTSWPDWMASLDRVEPGADAASVGGTRTVHIGRVAADEEFLAWEPGRRFAFVVLAMSAPASFAVASMVEDIQLEPVGEGRTRFTYTQGLELKGPFKLLRGVIQKQLSVGLKTAAPQLEAKAKQQAG